MDVNRYMARKNRNSIKQKKGLGYPELAIIILKMTILNNNNNNNYNNNNNNYNNT